MNGFEFQALRVPVPFLPATARPERFTYVDIETRKVALKRPVSMANGEMTRRRWDPILIGTGFWHEGAFSVEMTWGWSDWPAWFNALKARSDEMIYSATREFDEMILKGRFSNARRAHFARRPAGWPGIDERAFRWTNLRRRELALPVRRGADVESRLVPDVWAAGLNAEGELADWQNAASVLIHLFRDVLALALCDPDNPPLRATARKAAAELMLDFSACAALIQAADDD